MATGSFGGQLESAISGRLTGDPYEKRRQAAMGSYQDQASKSRKDLSERLNRLGVLRGGGATASQFGEFESGVLRGQQSIDAQFEAQRDAGVGQAIQQGIGLYGTNQQYGLAGRQQNEAERMGQFSRDLGTREFMSQDALRRDQQRESERSALAQEGMQRGALTGIYDGSRTLDQQRQDLAYRTGLAQTFGTDLGGDDTTRQTEARRAQGVQEDFQRAGITGTFDEKDTLQRSLAEAELTGRYGAEDTLAAQTLDLQEGQALGKIDGQDTLARESQREDRDLQAILGQAQINQQTAERASRVSESALEREARVGESQSDRELRAIQSQQQFNLATADRTSRESMQQAQFGEDARGREFQQTESTRDREFQMQMRASELEAQGVQAAEARKLAREELYGGVTTDYERAMGAKTLASSGQAADIAAENRRLAEMETAGVSQRGLAERELTQRSAMAAQQRALEREQLYGRAMTRKEQMSGLGYSGGTLGAQELEQAATQADLQRGLAREELYGYREVAGGRESTLGAAEAGRDRALRQQELEQRSTLAEADITSRERMAQEQRLLGREELYGTGDVSAQRGSTLASRQASQDLALRGELGRGQLAQDTRRTDLASAELYGTGDPRRQTGETAGAREARLGRGLEGRRLDEIERAGLVGEGLEARRLSEMERAGADTSRLQEAEVFGRQLNDYERQMGGMSTLAASEAAAERTSREGLAARDITARETEGRLGRGLAREELYGTGDAQQQMGATLAAREAAAGRTFERGERALDRGVTTAEGQRNRSLAREELYGTGDPMQQDRSLASQDFDLRRELGRGELAERVTAGAQGRALDRSRLDLQASEIFGEGIGRDNYARGGTLQSRLADEESDRYRREEQRRAIGMMQNLPADYAPSEREAQIVRDMLGIEGESDLAINERETGYRWSANPEERDKLFNPYGMSLSGYRTPAVDPNPAGGETGDGNGNGKPWWQDNFLYTIE